MPITSGQAYIFYPESTTKKCTATLLLDINPVELVRGKSPGTGEGTLSQYVNDRPYSASSFMGVTIPKVFRAALLRHCNEFCHFAIPYNFCSVLKFCGEARMRHIFDASVNEK